MTFTGFSEEISPFPDAGNVLLCGDHKPKKLQPIRSNNGGECGDVSSSPPEHTQIHEHSVELDANANSKGPLWEMVVKTLEEMGYYKRKNQTLVPPIEFQDNPAMGVDLEPPPLENQMSFHHQIAPCDAVDIANMLVALHNEGEGKCCNLGNTGDPKLGGDDGKETSLMRKSSCSSGSGSGSDSGSGSGGTSRSTKLELFMLNMVDRVLKKQDEMHNRFMEIINKYDQDRIKREEVWRIQELERYKREKEMRDEQTTRNLALISFIESILGHKIHIPQTLLQPITPVQPIRKKQKCQEPVECKLESNTKRWPEPEVKALISIRTAVDHEIRKGEFKHNTWEEVSQAMLALGFSRTANKCKEKWENINKYFRKTVERGQRPKSGKTCPYFQDLYAIYQNQKQNLVSTPIQMITDGGGLDKGDLKVCNLHPIPEALNVENGSVQ